MDSNYSKLESLISKWIVRFALNAGVALDASAQANYRVLWLEGFSDVTSDRLEAAFAACLRSHTFKNMPTIGDVRQHLEKAKSNACEEAAGRKWAQVLEYIRLHYSPDIPPKNAPRITERTQGAINAAGGLAYLADCEPEAKQWARKRFIESYVRYGELQQEQFLLPDGEIKKLLAGVAEAKALPGAGASFAELHDRGLAYAKQLAAPRPRIVPSAAPETVRVVDVEGRRRELARQAELIKAKYSRREAVQA